MSKLIFFTGKTMGRKCCVTNCRGNYDFKSKEKVFRLPVDENERKRWLSVIPRDNTPNTKDTVVCERHWPNGYETVMHYGKQRPLNLPSLFSCVKPSLLRTSVLPPRATIRSSAEVRSQLADELDAFNQKDKICSFESLQSQILNHNFGFSLIINNTDEATFLQSEDLLERTGIHKFLVKINGDLSFEAFHSGVKCSIISLSRNRVSQFTRWSQIEEDVRFLHTSIPSWKADVLHEQAASLGVKQVGERKYSNSTIVRAFTYFVISRTSYNRIRNDFELPSVTTLTRLTSATKRYDDISYYTRIFSNLPSEQRTCVLLVDEVYVKCLLQYHSGEVFGQATNNPNKLANTVLSYMVICMFGGPRFLCKMLPVRQLEADYLFDQTKLLLNNLKESGGNVVAIICDGNRVNQALFKKFDTINPWRTKNNLFLLFDYVHFLKNIRNNWITEATQELEFVLDGKKQIARWSDIKKLYYYESKEVVKMSPLTYEAVCPTPIERQKVKTCLRVFCDETISALKSHPEFDNVTGTVNFLAKVLEFWKIANVHSRFTAQQTRDDLREVISSSYDLNIQKLKEFVTMIENMQVVGEKRKKALTKDTSNCLSHTCNGLVEISQYLLLQDAYQYVMLGIFTTDPLENEFSKLRQRSGGTYFITAQQVLEKVNISKTRLLLKLSNISAVDLSQMERGHCCAKCAFVLDERMCEIIDCLL